MKQQSGQFTKRWDFTPVWFKQCANPGCGRLFVAVSERRKTCSDACRQAKHHAEHEPLVPVRPLLYEAPEASEAPSRASPLKRRNRAAPKKTYSRVCAYLPCSLSFKTQFKKTRYCSSTCRSSAFRSAHSVAGTTQNPQSHKDLSRTLAAIDAVDLSSLPSLDEILAGKKK